MIYKVFYLVSLVVSVISSESETKYLRQLSQEASWKNPTGLDGNVVYNGIAASANLAYSYATSANGYIWKSIDGGSSYQVTSSPSYAWGEGAISSSGTGQYVVAIGHNPTSKNFKPSFVVTSSDYGSSWSTPATINDDAAYVAVSGNGKYVYLTSFTKVFVSNNYGNSFTTPVVENNFGHPNPHAYYIYGPYGGAFTNVAVDKTGKYAYVPTDTIIAVWRTNDYGVSWDRVPLPSTAKGSPVNSACSDSGQVVYVLLSYSDSLSSVYKSTDSGKSYSLASSINTEIYSIATNQNGKSVYVGSGIFKSGSIYVSHDGGKTFSVSYSNGNEYNSIVVSNNGYKAIAIGDTIYVYS